MLVAVKRVRSEFLNKKNTMTKSKSIILTGHIESLILFIRGQKVMLDQDLANLYNVETKNLNKAMKRNLERFPEDFMFQLNKKEWNILRCQIGTSKEERGGRRYPPYVFTEYGALMLANILHSKRAVLVSIEVVRAFARLREVVANNKYLASKLDKLEKKYDHQFKVVFDAIRKLMTSSDSKHPPIGFRLSD